MPKIKMIADTLHKLVKPDMKPKELMASVRKEHPDATKKQIVRAALFCLIQETDSNLEQSKHLHTFALSKQADDEVDGATSQKLDKLRRRSKKARKLRTIDY